MLSNENLLNAQNEFITQLQKENRELRAKLRKDEHENRRLENLLRSAENALKEKDAELATLRTRINPPKESNLTPPPARKLEFTYCTPEQYEEIRDSIQWMKDYTTSFFNEMMKR